MFHPPLHIGRTVIPRMTRSVLVTRPPYGDDAARPNDISETKELRMNDGERPVFNLAEKCDERRNQTICEGFLECNWIAKNECLFPRTFTCLTTMAAIDQLVHHATILEFDSESVRTKKAKSRQPV